MSGSEKLRDTSVWMLFGSANETQVDKDRNINNDFRGHRGCRQVYSPNSVYTPEVVLDIFSGA
jgi:hypothetical protein